MSEKKEAIITNHAFERSQERLNLNKKSLQRLANKSISNGLTLEETKNEPALYNYLEGNVIQKRNIVKNVRVYGNNIFLFAEDNVLITIYAVPKYLTMLVKKCMEEKKSNLR